MFSMHDITKDFAKILESIEEKDARISELEEKIEAVVSYLALPKFAEERWVSIYDVLRILGRY